MIEKLYLCINSYILLKIKWKVISKILNYNDLRDNEINILINKYSMKMSRYREERIFSGSILWVYL
jgi:hypothetical protein